MRVLKYFGVLFAILFFSGCSLNEEPTPPNLTLPNSSNSVKIDSNWWEMYNDPVLNKLVEKAREHNFNLREAAANVALANAYLASADANRYPTIDGKGGIGRSQNGKVSKGGYVSNNFSLSAVLNYEIDLWGKIKNTKESAAKSLMASKATQEAIELGLVSSVVDSYFGVLSLKAQESMAKNTLKTREEVLDILKKKHELGLITSYDALLGESSVANAKTSLSSIQTQLVRQESALHVLLGTSPKELFEESDDFGDRLPDSITVPEGLNADLLEQRPDIQAALFALEAANLDIKVAKAKHFPSISLSGAFGFSSSELKNLIDSKSKNWNIGGSLVAPIFDYGRVEAEVATKEAAREKTLISFEQSVTQAFVEVYEAMSVRESIYETKNNALEQTNIYSELAKLALIRYEVGAGEYKNVLDAKEDLLSAELKLIQAKQSALSADISLIKSLGGGWDKKRLEN